MKQFVLKEGEQEGIYPGLGVAVHGQPLTAYGEEQEAAFRADPRFKLYRPDGAAEPDTDEKPAKGSKGAK